MAGEIREKMQEKRQAVSKLKKCQQKLCSLKFRNKKSSTSSLDNKECRVTFDEYNREISPTLPSSSTLSPLTTFYVTSEYCVVSSTRLPREKNCSDITLRCRFCTMKRLSTNEPFGFVTSPIAKLTTGTSLVDVVQPNSPAEKSGLLVGDRIMTVNGKRVNESTDVDKLIENALDVEFTVSRVDRISLQERGQQNSLSSKDSLNSKTQSTTNKSECSNSNNGKQCVEKKGSKLGCKFTKPGVEEDEEEFRHRYSWGTNTIIDRYPEARAMLRMLGRGPYSSDFRDYGYLSSY